MNNKCISLSTSSFKGGISKTTSLFTLGAYLWKYLDKHILFIDTDPQGNLTSMFQMKPEDIKAHGLINAYKHDGANPRAPWNLSPYKVNKYVDIITSTDSLSNVNDIMRHKRTLAPYVLFHYLSAIKATEKYDYILIDTHNNFALNTQDALICSDYTMIPVTASIFSMDGIHQTLNSINKLRNELINPVTSKSLIHSKVFMIGAIVPYNTKAGHKFLNAIHTDHNFITHVHRREAFNKANFHHEDIFEYIHKNGTSRDKDFINDEVVPAMSTIVKYINKE